MDPVDTHKHIKRLHLYMLVLTVAVFTLVWLIFKDQLSVTKKTEPSPTLVKVKKENRGVMTLQTKENQRNVAVGTPVTIQVVADSDAEDIVGFDVLLGYDKDAFTVTSATSPLNGYRVVNTEGDNYLSVTAVQDPQNATRNVFKEKVILEVVLTPQQAGEYTFTVMPKAGSESSKLVTTKTNILFPQVESLTVNVE